MLLIRSFIGVYLVILFSFFNSDWAEKSLMNIPVKGNTVSHGINPVVESYYNVKAVQVYTKSFFKNIFAMAPADAPERMAEQFLNTEACTRLMPAPAVFCAVKSYLHLLQLF